MRVLEVGGYAAGYAGRLFVRAGFDVLRLETEAPPAWASAEAMTSFLHAGKQRLRQPDQLAALAAMNFLSTLPERVSILQTSLVVDSCACQFMLA